MIELKLAIDQRDTKKVNALVEANPRSTWADHVQRNIGKKRARWMRDGHFAAALAR